MNQLDLILENIRLSYTERLLQEAQTDLELVRGQRLINESVMAIRGALVEEGVIADLRQGFGDAANKVGERLGNTYATTRNGIVDNYNNLKQGFNNLRQGFGDAVNPGGDGFSTNISAPTGYKVGGRLGNTYATTRNGIVNNSVPLAGGALGAGLGYALTDEDLVDGGYGDEAGAAMGAALGAGAAMGARKVAGGIQMARPSFAAGYLTTNGRRI